MEENIDVYFYNEKKNDEVGDLSSICLTTNAGNVKYIVVKYDEEPYKDKLLETKKKIILSFGITSSKHME